MLLLYCSHCTVTWRDRFGAPARAHDFRFGTGRKKKEPSNGSFSQRFERLVASQLRPAASTSLASSFLRLCQQRRQRKHDCLTLGCLPLLFGSISLVFPFGFRRSSPCDCPPAGRRRIVRAKLKLTLTLTTTTSTPLPSEYPSYISGNKKMSSPRSPSGVPRLYQIDFTAVQTGKHIASTKRRVRW
jgi:hypothetical protein